MPAKANTETAPTKTKTFDVPWSGTGDEIVEPGIGRGFVEWKKHGEQIRGVFLHKWQSRAMKSPAITLELTEKPKVRVIHTQGTGKSKTLRCKEGELVNVSMGYDLDRKLTADLEGAEVGLFYAGDQETPKGTMRVFKVYAFKPDALPF